MRPNPSLDRTSTGLALGPRGTLAYPAPRSLSTNPAVSAQLKRQAAYPFRTLPMTTAPSKHSTMPADWRIGKWWPIGPRVEDPVRLKEFSNALRALHWDESSRRDSLASVFDQLSRLAHSELRYYYKRRKAASRRAAAFRFMAWLLGTLGVLAPVVNPLFDPPQPKLLSWGFLAIALAGAFVVADTVFSGTEGHGRYVTTQLKLEGLFSKFSLEWQALLILYDDQPTAESAASLIERAIVYVDSFHESLSSETAEWQATMQRVREELAKSAPASNGDGAA